MKTHPKTRSRLGREDWLARALDILALEGEAKIRIDALVKKLGVTKGSFYWHFKNRDDFLAQLVRYWADSSTQPVIVRVRQLPGSAEMRLLALMEMILDTNVAGYDLAIRALAMHEPYLKPLVRRLDRRRYAFVSELFAEMGFSGDELAMRTRTFVVFHSLELGVLTHASKAERRRLLKLRHTLFTRE